VSNSHKRVAPLPLWCIPVTAIGQPNDQNWISAPEFRDFEQLDHSFSDLAAIAGGSFNLGVKGSPMRVVGASIYPNLFALLGAQPMLGRSFLAEEARPGRDREVILSYGLWQRIFQGNPNAIGGTLSIDGVPMTVVASCPKPFGACGVSIGLEKFVFCGLSTPKPLTARIPTWYAFELPEGLWMKAKPGMNDVLVALTVVPLTVA
jgi:hypothetical protein